MEIKDVDNHLRMGLDKQNMLKWQNVLQLLKNIKVVFKKIYIQYNIYLNYKWTVKWLGNAGVTGHLLYYYFRRIQF